MFLQQAIQLSLASNCKFWRDGYSSTKYTAKREGDEVSVIKPDGAAQDFRGTWVMAENWVTDLEKPIGLAVSTLEWANLAKYWYLRYKTELEFCNGTEEATLARLTGEFKMQKINPNEQPHLVKMDPEKKSEEEKA